MHFAHRGILIALVMFAVPAPINAYAPLGHEIVGPIADEIKGWDSKGADDPRLFHYSAHRNIDRQLRDFWRANQPTQDANSPAPSHHWFHYTDVPVVPPQTYRAGV